MSSVHFKGDDGGGGDDGSDANAQTARAYLLDGTTGIWPLVAGGSAGFTLRGDNTTLVAARSSAIGNGMLYVVHVTDLPAEKASLARYRIDGDGSLSFADDTPLDDAANNKFCLGARVAIAPDSRELAIGCDNSFVVTVELYADGRLGSPFVNENGNINSPRAPAWSPPGTSCVYIADDTAGASDVFAFELVTGMLSIASASPYFGPLNVSAIAAASNGDVFAVGNSLSKWTPKSGCALQPGPTVTAPAIQQTSLVVDDAHTLVFTAGHRLWAFDAATLTTISGYPILPVPGASNYSSMVLDPATHDLYLTAPAISGWSRVQVDAIGNVIAHTEVADATRTPDPVWLQLLPP